MMVSRVSYRGPTAWKTTPDRAKSFDIVRSEFGAWSCSARSNACREGSDSRFRSVDIAPEAGATQSLSADFRRYYVAFAVLALSKDPTWRPLRSSVLGSL